MLESAHNVLLNGLFIGDRSARRIKRWKEQTNHNFAKTRPARLATATKLLGSCNSPFLEFSLPRRKLQIIKGVTAAGDEPVTSRRD